jgi:6-pyruvoyl-tetrahydropterin synthase
MRLFVDNLTNVDFSYLCPIRGLVGETWLAHIQLDGSLDHQGMVCDFGLVKKTLREWLDKTLDHCLLVPNRSNAIRSTRDSVNTLVELTLASNELIRVESPSQSITLLDAPTITPESVAEWCVKQLQNVFGSSVAQIHLSFSAETIETPYYHYSHGLKKHRGHCQRIAHGHRSKLLIWRNGRLCMESIQEWTERWRDIYIGTQEDCFREDDLYLGFTYRAQQGDFRLTLPKKSCYLINNDTTVELLAQHIATTLGRQYPNEEILVKAFEGIGKGAIAIPPAINE